MSGTWLYGVRSRVWEEQASSERKGKGKAGQRNAAVSGGSKKSSEPQKKRLQRRDVRGYGKGGAQISMQNGWAEGRKKTYGKLVNISAQN